MGRKTSAKTTAAILILLLGTIPGCHARATTSTWTPLFNGKDLSGWDSYLGPPKPGEPAVGLNRDPSGVFSIVQVDGVPAIRVTGTTWGVLASRAQYENFHLRLEFKWGTEVHPPLNFRDSGVMYYSAGEHGAVTAGGGSLASPPGSGFFMKSLELQIAQGDVGSCYSLGDALVNAPGVRAVIKRRNCEKPLGEWNVVEIYCVGSDAVHVVNGSVVAVVKNARYEQDGKTIPMTRGKIQLQSESAEIFFRNVAIEQITAMPAGLLATP